MLIFAGRLVSWAVNSFCPLIYRELFLRLSEHVSGKKTEIIEITCNLKSVQSMRRLDAKL